MNTYERAMGLGDPEAMMELVRQCSWCLRVAAADGSYPNPPSAQVPTASGCICPPCNVLLVGRAA